MRENLMSGSMWQGRETRAFRPRRHPLTLPYGALFAKNLTSINVKRIHLFEFTDLSWYPDLFRRFQTDYVLVEQDPGYT
jgi:hypothetical protein